MTLTEFITYCRKTGDFQALQYDVRVRPSFIMLVNGMKWLRIHGSDSSDIKVEFCAATEPNFYSVVLETSNYGMVSSAYGQLFQDIVSFNEETDTALIISFLN